jgi:dolichyl-phosphate beta-glucosyltransferase
MDLSIIVPAYNEEKRMIPFLEDLIKFSKTLKSYEIILVNDGSKDKTLEIMEGLKKKNKNIKIVSYEQNKGKAGALKEGINSALGEKILFIDADGSIPPYEIKEMVNKLDNYDVVVGNRASKESKITQSLLRKTTGILFNTYVNILFGLGLQDNLCGFKGFRKNIAKYLFNNLISKGWIFDVELFYRIKEKSYSLYQQPIRWINKKDSKIKPFDPIKMAFQLIILRKKIVSKK